MLIRFEPDTTKLSVKPTPQVEPPVKLQSKKDGSDSVKDLVRALDRAEARPNYQFVALKWFRDVALPAEGFDWAQSDAARQNALRDAIERRLILTSKVPNPKSPQFPVTAIRLNRLLPQILAILGAAASDSDFSPVEIRGDKLSATVLRERR